MSTRLVICVMLAVAFIPCTPAAANRGKALQTVVKLLTGAGAAESLRRSAHNYEEYQAEKSVLARLQAKGVDGSKCAIYSVYFKTSAGYWSDFWTKPDLFFYVDIEGVGSFLVPQIHNDYAGTPILDRVLAAEVAPGTRIVVRVLDDDTSSDEIWNNILKTRVNLEATAALQVTTFIPVRLSASGQLQLLEHNVTIDAPDYVATAEFRVPQTSDGVWVADGQLWEPDGTAVGAIQMASMWSARQELTQQTSKTSSLFSSTIFWLVVGGCLLLWFLKSVFSPSTSGGQART